MAHQQPPHPDPPTTPEPADRPATSPTATPRSATYRQPAHMVIGILRGEWTIAVLSTLATGPHQHGELRDKINKVEASLDEQPHNRTLSNKVFSDTLKSLRRDGLITRTERERTFGPVWYQLTPIGREFLRAIAHLAKLGTRYTGEIETARTRFDKGLIESSTPERRSRQ